MTLRLWAGYKNFGSKEDALKFINTKAKFEISKSLDKIHLNESFETEITIGVEIREEGIEFNEENKVVKIPVMLIFDFGFDRKLDMKMVVKYGEECPTKYTFYESIENKQFENFGLDMSYKDFRMKLLFSQYQDLLAHIFITMKAAAEQGVFEYKQAAVLQSSNAKTE